jgi:uridine kinase
MVDAAHLPSLAVGAAVGGIVSRLCCASIAAAGADAAADAPDAGQAETPSPAPRAMPAPGRPLHISSTQDGGSEGTEVLVIGVCGGSGSGKSTVAEKLVGGIGDHQLAYLSHDWYYRDQSHITSMDERAANNYDHPKSLETDLLAKHVKMLKGMVDIRAPQYNFAEHTRFGGLDWEQSDSKLVTAAPIVLVEGILLFEHEELRNLIDIRLFVHADADLRFIRRMTRDVAERGRKVPDVVKQYTETVRPMHIKYVEPMKAHAHIVLPENEPNETADALLLSFVRQRVDSVMKNYAQTILRDRQRWEASSDSELTETQMLQVVAAFRASDVDGNGALSLAELRYAREPTHLQPVGFQAVASLQRNLQPVSARLFLS